MKINKLAIIMALTFACAPTFVGATPAQKASKSFCAAKDMNEVKLLLCSSIDRVNALKNEVTDLTSKFASLTTKQAETDKTVGDLKTEQANLDAELKNQATKISDLDSKVSKLETPAGQ